MTPLRIAIVDDEPPARMIVREYLEAEPGVEIVAECANGFDAVKAVAEANALDVEIAADERRFGVHRDARLRSGAQAVAEEIRQLEAHPAGAGGIVRDQRSDGVEAVEQKVGIDLRA